MAKFSKKTVEKEYLNFKYEVEAEIEVQKITHDYIGDCNLAKCDNKAIYKIYFDLLDMLDYTYFIRRSCEEHKDKLGVLKGDEE